MPEKDEAQFRDGIMSEPGFSGGMQYIQPSNYGVDTQIKVTPDDELEDPTETQLCKVTLPSGTSGDAEVPIDWNEHVVGDESLLGVLGFTEEHCPQIDESQAQLEYFGEFELS